MSFRVYHCYVNEGGQQYRQFKASFPIKAEAAWYASIRILSLGGEAWIREPETGMEWKVQPMEKEND